HCEYLWSLKDLLAQSHTANLNAEELDKIIEIIGNEKFSTVVLNAGSNVQMQENYFSKI
ncbi:17506_t:CDS:1, partial [Gigaspora margarita]